MNLRQIPTLRIISDLIFSVFLLKGVFLSLLVPIFQNPDEQIHCGTVQHRAEPQEKDWEIREIGRRDPISSDILRPLFHSALTSHTEQRVLRTTTH